MKNKTLLSIIIIFFLATGLTTFAQEDGESTTTIEAEIIEEIEHKKIPGYARGGMEQIEYRSNRAIFELLVDIRDIDAYELNFDMRSKEEMLHDIETRGFWLYAVGCRGQIEVRSLQATAEVLADIRDIKLEKLKEEALK